MRPRQRAALLLVVLAAMGCKKTAPPLAPSKIHAISRELAEAARSAAPKTAGIRVSLQASNRNPQAVDLLDIHLDSTREDPAERSKIASIQQLLDDVATRHGLTVEPSESREGILFYYLRAGARTHEIHIRVGPGLSRQDNSSADLSSSPKLAIILDDLGSDRNAAETIFALPYPLTISVLPNHEHSADIAEEAERRGFQVMLHLPMQSIANEKPEARELRPGMPDAEVSALVDDFLRSVPGAVGVNNHQGSQATSDAGLMSELMPALGERNLFYVDSRTSAATVAYDTAQSFGVPSAFRNVPFLDDVPEAGVVRKQLELALRGALKKGEAVAIGHAHPATIQAMQEILPQAQPQGVHLVFVSELVH